MKLMHSEWQDRVKHWVRTLRDDFYEPLGEIRWEAFRTMDHLSPEEALQGTLHLQNQVLYGGKPGNTVGLKAL